MGMDEFEKLRLEREAQYRAHKLEQLKAHWGVLAGGWHKSRLNCRACGFETVGAEGVAEIFLGSDDDDAVRATIDARKEWVFDTKDQSRPVIPEWVAAELPLWREPHPYGEDCQPLDIVTSREFVMGGSPRSRRLIEEVSHIFLRPCPNCAESDPLHLVPELIEAKFSTLQPPHSFIETLRVERAAYEEEVREHAERPAPVPEGKACNHCSSINILRARFCRVCGNEFAGA